MNNILVIVLGSKRLVIQSKKGYRAVRLREEEILQSDAILKGRKLYFYDGLLSVSSDLLFYKLNYELPSQCAIPMAP